LFLDDLLPSILYPLLVFGCGSEKPAKMPMNSQKSRLLKVIKEARIAPKVLLPGAGAKGVKKDSLCQKSGYRGRDG
jgi:hypothetical protein